MGDVDYDLAGLLESSVRYHSCSVRFLTLNHYLVKEQFQAGSLTGAVASQTVTEAREGWLRAVGNRSLSAMAEASLTARLTSRAESKDGHSDPVVPSGRAIAQRIKGTPGITG